MTNITAANVYYTGTVRGYAPNNLFGTVASPNGTFVVNGSQDLSATGIHYFYLAYSVPVTANIGDGLDARLDSFVFSGMDISDMIVSNPAGFRTITDTVCLQPDLPNPNANPQLVKSGSLIIPMDLTNQALTAPFNLKAYGLVHNLLLNDVPLRWVIRSGKARNDTDFSALAERKWPSVIAPAVTEFRAGAFIIDSAWVTTAFSPWVLDATTIINNFANNVAVFELKEDKLLDVRYEMNQRPKLAVFDNGGFQAIHVGILIEAGLTPIDTANPLLIQSGLELSLYDPGVQTVLVKHLLDRQHNALVMGHSNTIPELARLLCQCAITAMDESEHDRMIVISVSDGEAKVRTLQQNRLFQP